MKNTLTAFVLLLCSLLGWGQNKKIVVIGLDTTQFYSNAYFLEDLAKANMCEPKDVSKMFGLRLSAAISNYSYDSYVYELASFREMDSVRREGTYGTLNDREGNEYLGVIPLNRDQKALKNLIKRRSAEYILSINLYELLAQTKEFKTGDPVLHVIHFDLLDKNLKLIHSGKFESVAVEYSVFDLEWYFDDFALDLIFWIKTTLSGNEDIFGQYQKEIDTYFNTGKAITAKNGIGILGGTGMPYGGLGLEYSYLRNDYWEITIGAGYDFSGFKMGTGVRFYPLGNQGKATRPFAGINLGFATGNKYALGGEKDEFGTQLNPDDVTVHKIYGDGALYFQGGLAIIVADGLGVIPTLGYAFPFAKRTPDLISGPEKKGRENFAKFNAVGGLILGLTITGYW